MVNLINHDKWAPVLGNFMIAFGYIESNVNGLLKLWCEPAIYGLVSRQMLRQRLDMLEALAKVREYGPGNSEVMAHNIAVARKLAQERNVIAHNPLMLRFFDPESVSPEAIDELEDFYDPNMTVLQEVISPEAPGKHLSFQNVRDLTVHVRELANTLAQNVKEIGYHGDARIFGDDGKAPYVAKLWRAAMPPELKRLK